MKERLHLQLVGEDGRRELKKHVSFSELRLFYECNWKWVLLKVQNKSVVDTSFQMEFGKAVHSGMEILYSPGGTAELATAHASKLYEQSLSVLDIAHPTDLAEAIRIKNCISGFYRDCLICPDLQGITTLKSELQLYEPIARTDGLDIKFKGFIDIVFVKKLKRKTVIYIADFKTCQWGWPAKKLQDPEVLAQLLLYKHFFCKMTGADPKNVSAAFILLKKKPKVISAKGVEPVVYDIVVDVEKISAGPKSTQRALDYLQDAITAMHSGVYERNRDACTRGWTDSVTKEERSVSCPFFDTISCPSMSV